MRELSTIQQVIDYLKSVRFSCPNCFIQFSFKGERHVIGMWERERNRGRFYFLDNIEYDTLSELLGKGFLSGVPLSYLCQKTVLIIAVEQFDLEEDDYEL